MNTRSITTLLIISLLVIPILVVGCGDDGDDDDVGPNGGVADPSARTLLIELTPAQITELGTSQAIGIARTMGSPEAEAVAVVLWVELQFLEEVNELEWSLSDMRAYASSSALQVGTKVLPLADIPVAFGKTYRFETGAFVEDTNASSPDRIAVVNDSESELTFGLAAPMSNNGNDTALPYGGIVVPPNATVELWPSSDVFVFITPTSDNSTVLLGIPDSALMLDMGTTSSFVLEYDDKTETFIVSN
ncbi:MAG: hypothetical protein GY854_20125 [Deltaproteobacteria bacterium]|nr:hypothetical protein [Deltaproteobacteria bacterium]